MTTAASTDFLEFAEAARREIDAALDRYTQYDDDCPRWLADAIRHSLLAPGKRLRPMLVLMAAEACGCEWDKALPAACSVEMIHAYSLIHDDLPAMDDDDLRRGRPTCHAAFGESTAILAGDALLAQAFEVLAEGAPSPSVAARSVVELAHASGPTALVGGQADDLAGEHAGGGLERLEAIHRRKTGALLLVSVRLGGLTAAADEEKLAALDSYGRKLGLAFQITDDLLDHSGDQAVVGKRIGKDQDRGKLTFPSLLGVEESTRRAEQLIAQARGALSPFGAKAGRLDSLARYVLERNR